MNRNKKMRKKMMAGVAVGMAGIISAMPVCAATGDSVVTKEETVYVNATADGTQTKITVSDWLKNAGKADMLEDRSELSGIKNVKGDETFTNSNDKMTWKTDGEDIYYQGTSDKELPVSVKFTYYLDGKETAPENLKGKSGKLRIKIDYMNRAKRSAVIDGKEEEIYTPFVMVTGMILPEENFSNVVIDNGKVISDGQRNMVLGVGMPGLKESLGLDEESASSLIEEIRIPESLEITAEVKDFSMEPTFTVAFSDILKELKPDDTKDLNSVMSSLEQLEDVALKLVDGSCEISKGADKLGAGYEEFDEGVGTLKDGIGALKSGVLELSGGIGSYTQGADILNEGIQKYMGKNGALNVQVREYVNGVDQVAKGAQDYMNGAAALADGVKNYVAGEEQIAQGAEQLTTLKEGLNEVKSAIAQLNAAVDGKGSSSEDIYAASQALAQGTQKLNDSLESMDVLFGQVDSMTAAGKDLTTQAGKMSEAVKKGILAPTENMLGTGNEMMKSLKDISVNLENINGLCQEAVKQAGAELTSGVNQQITAKNMEIQSRNAQIASAKDSAANTNAKISAVVSELKNEAAKAREAGNEELAASISATADKLSNVTASVNVDALENLSPVETLNIHVELPSVDFSGLRQQITDIEKQFSVLQETVDGLEPQLLEMNRQLEAMAEYKESIPDNAMGMLKQNVKILNENMHRLNGAVGIFSQNIGALDKETEKLPEAAAGIDRLQTGLKELSKANPLLVGGADALKGNTPALAQGLQTLLGGTKQLSSGLTTLGNELSGGSAALSMNSAALRNGASKLISGTDELVFGAGSLKNASMEVKTGIGALQEGALQLKDGTVAFNEDGIKKLQEAAEELLGNVLDRIDALTSEDCSYDSYAGKVDGMAGSVKFIIETEGVE